MDNWLQKRTQLTPHRLALSFHEQRWTFTELQRQVNGLCAVLQPQLPPTGRIAILGDNTPELYFGMLTLHQLGIPIVCLNKHLTAPELQYQITDAQVQTVLTTQAFLPHLEATATRLHLIALDQLTWEPRTDWTAHSTELDALASVMYTSGTTSRPKGVCQSYRNHWTSALGAELNLPVTEADAWICAVPLYHISGLSILMRSLLYGMPVRLYDHFDSQAITQDLVHGRGTIISVVPYMLKKLLAEKQEPYSSDFSYMLLGGGAIDQATLNQCKRKNIPVIQSYGMTETASQVVALNPAEAQRKLGSVGKPLFPVSLKIANDAQPYQVGEILLKGDNLTPGYLNQPERFAALTTATGWFRTGDLGYIDDEGFLYVKSRLTELIISGGENIYPHEIELVLNQLPGVQASAVIGKPDPTWGAIPVAFLVTNRAWQLTAVQDFLTGKLAKYKFPKELHLVDHLPHTTNGKLKRGELLQWLEKWE
ncbi:o-succinylbenzoate--CoA ligase [Fructilactobacillus myrtifloralis]|uniref:2-succinylbenzoate--CoA ligase n=1 Tax=Fructilactobacillus myrtifloralis TaxID=2940301 RepID=A0ABY5BNA7_9LACO|nr:o-succinylbenzoate--CoA ligase [Fructilactobacillus myrtifloralis]USS84592.1 o-succinylbenzoate--CoA ligase [Fructilactobacillus myrtifloralis]